VRAGFSSPFSIILACFTLSNSSSNNFLFIASIGFPMLHTSEHIMTFFGYWETTRARPLTPALSPDGGEGEKRRRLLRRLPKILPIFARSLADEFAEFAREIALVGEGVFDGNERDGKVGVFTRN
jgi:hypothetical protein